MQRIIVAIIVSVVAALPVHAQRASMAGRSTVYAPHGAIATSHPLASAAGLEVLQNRGNAIDAAIAAAAVLTVVEPHMVSIGGDMFAIVWSARDKKLYGLNGSGRAGSLMTRQTLVERGRTSIPSRGAEAITVPGAVSGWAALLEKFGSRPLAQLLAPAIRIADEGFPVSPIIAGDWDNFVTTLQRDEGARATYLINGERAPREGEWFHNADYAKTLRDLAARGPAYFYGDLGKRIAEHVQKLGGFLTPQDFTAHQAEWIEPVSAQYREYRLWELPPNGQGLAALEMLRILEPYDLKAMGHNSAQYLHTLIEAKKLAYADIQHYVGDPAHMTVTPAQLLSDKFIAARRALIDPKKAMTRPEPGDAMTRSETIYLTVADAQGNMVSFINSLFSEFGSGVVVPGTGFALQNRGSGFTLTEGVANTVAPRKRPFHTLVPAFVTKTTSVPGMFDVTREEPFMSFGVMGGAMQPQGHIQVLLNMVVFGMGPQQAVDAARFRHMSAMNVSVEAPIAEDVRARLAALGHVVSVSGIGTFGGAQLIQKLPRGWAAASDPRKDGLAIGH
jgi:gamma-glutamyltranspeptidase / glutathione hydrolase